MYTRGQIVKTETMVNNKMMHYKVKFHYWWEYAETLEEAERLSEIAKKTW